MAANNVLTLLFMRSLSTFKLLLPITTNYTNANTQFFFPRVTTASDKVTFKNDNCKFTHRKGTRNDTQTRRIELWVDVPPRVGRCPREVSPFFDSLFCRTEFSLQGTREESRNRSGRSLENRKTLVDFTSRLSPATINYLCCECCTALPTPM